MRNPLLSWRADSQVHRTPGRVRSHLGSWRNPPVNGLYDAKLDKQPVLAITGLQYHDLVGTHTQQDVALDEAVHGRMRL